MDKDESIQSVVKFDATIEELVDMGYRSAELSGQNRRVLFNGFWAVPVCAGAFLLGIPDTMKVKIVFAILVGIIAAIMNVLTLRFRMRKELRLHFSHIFGGSESIKHEYALVNDGIEFKQGETEVTVSWRGISSIRKTEEYLEIITDQFAVAQVPARAYASPDMMEKWADHIARRVSPDASG